MAKKPVESVVVTVDDQHLPNIQSVATALQAAGMHVSNVMPVTGIITGEVEADKRSACKNVPGVAAVESDEEMRAI